MTMPHKICSLLTYIAGIYTLISAYFEPNMYELLSYSFMLIIIGVLFEILGEIKKGKM
jgi:hypothetical protein